MRLECTNEECGYSWDYQGESQFYATCPKCKSSVNITKQSENREELEVDENAHTQAIKAVTKKYFCDFCGNDYSTQRECAKHVLEKHISEQ